MSCFLLEQDFFIAVVKMLGHKTSTMTFLKRLYSRSYQAFFMNIISGILPGPGKYLLLSAFLVITTFK